MKIVKAIQTLEACPSEWDAWTETGQYLYLRYRWGCGTVETQPSDDTATWIWPPELLASFDTGKAFDGEITLEEFAERAGLTLELP